MNSQESLEKLEMLSFTAAMNQRYHQSLWTRYGRIDKLIRISVGAIALLSVVFSLMSSTSAVSGAEYLSAVVSVAALAVAIALNVYPSAEKVVVHRDLFRRWSDLREDTDSLQLRVYRMEGEELSGELINRISELTGKKNRINSLEDSPNEELLRRCYEAENRSRTGFGTHAEYEEQSGAVA